MPAFGPDRPRHEWPLSKEGLAAACRLTTRLPADARLVAGEERKAWQTLGSGAHVVRDRRFNEVSRVEPWEGDFRRLRRAYVEGTDHFGWERRHEVVKLRLTDPGSFWEYLRFPDAHLVDTDGGKLKRI